LRIINADWKRYNANSNNKNVGDCVKRSLSFAYGVDYDVISRQLNKIKRDIHADAFNSRRVFTKFLIDNGAEGVNVAAYEQMTEAEFCEKFNSGVYICLSGPESKTWSTHMVCIMNGDIIDSWNSSNYIVREAWEIPNVSDIVEDITWSDIEKDMDVFAESYLEKVNKKYEQYFEVKRMIDIHVNDTTYKMKFQLRTTPNVPERCMQVYPNYLYVKYIVIKVNPRMNIEQNLKSLQPKLKQKIYDWIYPYQKDIKDTLKVMEMKKDDKFSKQDSYTLRDSLRFPEWVRPYIVDFWESPDNTWSDKYEVTIKAMPGDPDVPESAWENKLKVPTFRFSADTMKDLKEQLEEYRKSYKKPRHYNW